jgi:hypothetical protein
VPAATESKLLQARVKMQQKYLDQYMELYEVGSAAVMHAHSWTDRHQLRR